MKGSGAAAQEFTQFCGHDVAALGWPKLNTDAEGAAERYRTFLSDLELAGSPPESAFERLSQVLRLWGIGGF